MQGKNYSWVRYSLQSSHIRFHNLQYCQGIDAEGFSGTKNGGEYKVGDLIFYGKEKEFVLADHSLEAFASMHRVGRFSYCIVSIIS